MGTGVRGVRSVRLVCFPDVDHKQGRGSYMQCGSYTLIYMILEGRINVSINQPLGEILASEPDLHP